MSTAKPTAPSLIAGHESALEKTFLFKWKACQGPELAREFVFHPTRKWRFDFAHVESRTAIEIEGGIWTASRHTTGRGFSNDCEKYNEAALRGWAVFRLTDAMINLPTLGRIHHHIKTKHLPCPSTSNPPSKN